jgi:hypothetical protein
MKEFKTTAHAAPAKREPNGLYLREGKPCEDDGEALARTLLRPNVGAALTIQQYAKNLGDLDLTGLVYALEQQIDVVNDGNLKRAEGMLLVQAHSLDALFNSLAQRAAVEIGEHLHTAETYLRLALKAQSQCRATLETLVLIKNPPNVAFVGQANIAHGPQQVNNAVARASEPSRARKTENLQSKLLED